MFICSFAMEIYVDDGSSINDTFEPSWSDRMIDTSNHIDKNLEAEIHNLFDHNMCD